ncbi:MAG: ECF transporter S component [Candidatus Bathyarchaeia archaeon]
MAARFVIQLTLSAVMASLVIVATYIIRIPNPPTGGYINFGDVMIFFSALSFGSFVGGFAGGVGSSIADIIAGYSNFAPFTLVIKGIEGAIAGFIGYKRKLGWQILAVIVAGTEMILGYFIAEFYPLQVGWAALTEVPGNILQIFTGGVVGIPLANIVHKRLPEILKY